MASKPQVSNRRPNVPAPKASPKTSTAVAKASGTELSDTIANALEAHAGKGISDRQEDNIVPLIYLLQANSKPAMKGHEKYIDGAVGGTIWLRNAPLEICLVDGDEGMLFQPCHFSVCHIEWLPNRGGFVARHADRPSEAVYGEYEDDKGNVRTGWLMPNGNIISESREYAGLVHLDDHEPMAYTIPLSGSGHTVGRQWMSSMREERLPNGQRAPLFANLYRLRTKLRTKGENSWYQYEISKEGPVQTVEDVERGAALYAAFEAGAKRSAAHEDVDVADDGGSAGDDGGDVM